MSHWFPQRTYDSSSRSLRPLSATHARRCNEHGFQLNSLSLESKFRHAAPAVIQPRTPLISFYCLATDSLRRSLFGDSFYTISGLRPGELPSFWGSMVVCHAPIPIGRGQIKTTTHRQNSALYYRFRLN